MMSLVMLCVATLAFQAGYTEAALPDDYWRNPKRCGPNCLYAYLKLHGHDVSLDDIGRQVPVGPEGANMADLRRAATNLGVPSRVVKLSPADLMGCPLPAIAHLHSLDGHFVLLLDVTPQTVVTADMLSGHVEVQATDRFFELWSGYVLVPASGLEWQPVVLAAGSLVLAGLAVRAWRRSSV